MTVILFINIMCTALVLFTSIFLLIFGSKTLSTVFHGIFWFIIFLYLLSLTLFDAGLIKLELSQYIHFFIPAFYSLFLFARLNRFIYLSILFILFAVLSVFFINLIYIILYHIIIWAILIFITAFFREKSNDEIIYNEKEKDKKYGVYAAIIIGCAVTPFLIINIINGFLFPGILSKNNAIEIVLPPSLALAALLFLYYSYKHSLVILNHDFYANLNFLKQSNAVEKKTILEKISAGLIHEIKNPIGAIQSLNQQLLENHNNMKKEKINDYLNIIDREIIRVRKLAENYLQIFKKDIEPKKELIKIHDALTSIVELLKYDLIKNSISIDIDNSLFNKEILFNNNQFRQVFLNLIYNSIEAHAKNIKISAVTKDNMLNILIIDDGVGIPADIKNKIFSPFYTTKIDGTGMGLVICKEILNDNFSNIKLVKSKQRETIFDISINKKSEGEG